MERRKNQYTAGNQDSRKTGTDIELSNMLTPFEGTRKAFEPNEPQDTPGFTLQKIDENMQEFPNIDGTIERYEDELK